jgi:hypothetical protein
MLREEGISLWTEHHAVEIGKRLDMFEQDELRIAPLLISDPVQEGIRLARIIGQL